MVQTSGSQAVVVPSAPLWRTFGVDNIGHVQTCPAVHRALWVGTGSEMSQPIPLSRLGVPGPNTLGWSQRGCERSAEICGVCGNALRVQNDETPPLARRGVSVQFVRWV